MKILVTGGAGYIGGITAKVLSKAGHRVVIFDNLEKGHQELVDLLGLPFIKGDVRNRKDLLEALSKSIDAVIHFAAYIESGLSMKEPLSFYQNNTGGGINLLTAMKETGVNKLVFSSTAGVYGNAEKMPLTEETPLQPTSHYCRSKRLMEQVIEAAAVQGISSVILRYFNASGALPDGSIGEDHDPETHLIPLVIKTALGYREKISVYGADYPTPDGTAVRDYIHVLDLAEAHLLALEKVAKSASDSVVYNVGLGEGYSVKQVIEMVKDVTGTDFKIELSPRRAGDWAVAWADPSKIKKELNWEPRYNLRSIIESALRWHKLHPQGWKSA